MAAESLREASSAAPGATVEGAAVGAGTQHAAALHHFFEQLLSKLLFDESPVELVEPSADALCDLQPIFLPSPCIFQAPFWTHRQPPNLWVYRLALVLAAVLLPPASDMLVLVCLSPTPSPHKRKKYINTTNAYT